MMKLTILSPEWSREVEADAVFFPGALGEFEVLKDHAPIISVLTAGSIRWSTGGEESSLDIRGGVMKLKDNEIQVCIS